MSFELYLLGALCSFLAAAIVQYWLYWKGEDTLISDFFFVLLCSLLSWAGLITSFMFVVGRLTGIDWDNKIIIKGRNK